MQAWKLFFLIPQMLLRPTDVRGAEGKRIFAARMAHFDAGRWRQLLEEAAEDSVKQRALRRGRQRGIEPNAMMAQVQRKVKEGEMSRARLLLKKAWR